MKFLAFSICVIFMTVLISCNNKKSDAKNTDKIEKTNNAENRLNKVDVQTNESDKTLASFSNSVLPLEPGFYVLEDSDCENAANAAWRYWDGTGLSGSATKDCKMKLVQQDGKKYQVSETCTNTYDKSKSESNLTVVVNDKNHFVLMQNSSSQKFRFCEHTPSWLKK